MEGKSPTRGRQINNDSSSNGRKRNNARTADMRDEDESSDPIGYQAIVLDPNPKAVCQLLGMYNVSLRLTKAKICINEGATNMLLEIAYS